MLREFRDFIARGNVLDLAVAVIIGAAFATIATSLTEDIIMPVVGAIFGGLDFSSYFVLLGPVPEGYARLADRLCGAEGSRRAGARLGPVRHRPDQLPDPRLHHLPVVSMANRMMQAGGGGRRAGGRSGRGGAAARDRRDVRSAKEGTAR